MHSRIKEDKEYAQLLLNFINSIDLNKTYKPQQWLLAKAYLYFITNDINNCLSVINYSKSKNIREENIVDYFSQVEHLALIRQQKNGQHKLPKTIEDYINNKADSNQYAHLFAMARELEFKGNTTDAAILLASISNNRRNTTVAAVLPALISNNRGYSASFHLKTKKNHKTLYSDFYDDYFFYLDAQYEPDELESLIIAIKEHQVNKNNWRYKNISSQLDRIYDLLGTKYLRRNELEKAYNSFVNVNTSMWESDEYPYKVYLNANPFFTNLFNEHALTTADTIKYTKPQLLAQLLAYIKMANNIENKDRDYYYFLVANCYFNMTQYGNSWLMRRYYWTMNFGPNMLIDDSEYYKCLKAKYYYGKAAECSISDKFKALCIKMMARCENYKFDYEVRHESTIFTSVSWADYLEKKEKANIYLSKLKSDYPNHFEELQNNCLVFYEYFNSRR